MDSTLDKVEAFANDHKSLNLLLDEELNLGLSWGSSVRSSWDRPGSVIVGDCCAYLSSCFITPSWFMGSAHETKPSSRPSLQNSIESFISNFTGWITLLKCVKIQQLPKLLWISSSTSPADETLQSTVAVQHVTIFERPLPNVGEDFHFLLSVDISLNTYACPIAIENLQTCLDSRWIRLNQAPIPLLLRQRWCACYMQLVRNLVLLQTLQL